jgi:hypothetical protein
MRKVVMTQAKNSETLWAIRDMSLKRDGVEHGIRIASTSVSDTRATRFLLGYFPRRCDSSEAEATVEEMS